MVAGVNRICHVVRGLTNYFRRNQMYVDLGQESLWMGEGLKDTASARNCFVMIFPDQVANITGVSMIYPNHYHCKIKFEPSVNRL